MKFRLWMVWLVDAGLCVLAKDWPSALLCVCLTLYEAGVWRPSIVKKMKGKSYIIPVANAISAGASPE